MSEDTYSVNVFCSNCDLRGSVNIPRGVTVEEHKCEQCGNVTLGKVHEPVRLTPDIPNYL